MHKKKRLVQGPNSFFMDVKCPGCFNMYVLLISLFLSVSIFVSVCLSARASSCCATRGTRAVVQPLRLRTVSHLCDGHACMCA